MRRAGPHHRLAVAASVLFVVAGCRPDDAPAAAPEESPAPPAPDAGVTDEPCADAANPDNGCVYLGSISDLERGPFSELGVALTEAQEAFWARVNDGGGVGGYDVDVTTHVRDGGYEPAAHAEAYDEIAGDVLALAQTLGTETTAAILDRMDEHDVIGVPAAWHSSYAWNDLLVGSGGSYCVQAMNSVDVAVETLATGSVVAVRYPGDFGEDAAAGAQIAAEAHGLEYEAIVTRPGEEGAERAAASVLEVDPGAVVLATGPLEAGVIVGNAAAAGFTGGFFGTAPSFHPALLETPVAEALQALYLVATPWAPWDADTDGHDAMREWVGRLYPDATPSDAHTAGWALQYPLLAALEQAAEDELTRAALRAAAGTLEAVDSEGMVPRGSGDPEAAPEEALAREVMLAQPDPGAPAGLRVVRDFFTGPTVDDHPFAEPCA